MERTDLLRRFDREHRQQPGPIPGARVERGPGYVRSVGSENVLLWYDLGVRGTQELLDEQVRYFRARAVPFEWKVYGHDRAEDLAVRLDAAGFLPAPAETLMIRELAGPLPEPAVRPSVTVRRVASERAFEEFADVTAAAFEDDRSERIAELRARISDPSVALFVAYVDGEPASAGRVELPPGASIAGLWGGGTVPRYRHRGLYRTLVAARAELARGRGYRYVIVEAAETSRPVLERLGFTPLDRVVGWNSPALRRGSNRRKARKGPEPSAEEDTDAEKADLGGRRPSPPDR